MTMGELLDLPATVDLPTAGRAFGLGRNTSYQLARRGEFPCRVLRLGRSYVVPTAELLRVLGLDLPNGPTPEDSATTVRPTRRPGHR
ncbi:DNA-binding protein [Actinomadura sp. 6N118]|uniref:DNA-binding protein n=1 Tax=Actinomadura sp. 6N118 TaxID=3375151 RepID=UPI0037BBAA08